MTSIRVHLAPRDIVKDAVAKMDQIMASNRFTDPKIKDAATHVVERYRGNVSRPSMLTKDQSGFTSPRFSQPLSAKKSPARQQNKREMPGFLPVSDSLYFPASLVAHYWLRPGSFWTITPE
jgi:hypothetical protein